MPAGSKDPMTTYAIIDTTTSTITRILDDATDMQAKETFRREGLRSENGAHPALVSLDEEAHVGDRVSVDDDGVATVVTATTMEIFVSAANGWKDGCDDMEGTFFGSGHRYVHPVDGGHYIAGSILVGADEADALLTELRTTGDWRDNEGGVAPEYDVREASSELLSRIAEESSAT